MTKYNSLFLDRDGVINTIEYGFVNEIEDFIFCTNALTAINILADHFDHIFVVTNQAGIGYGYMSKSTLEAIHAHMIQTITNHGGRIDKVYYCPDKVSKAAVCRKPNGGMAIQAKKDFPTVKFKNSWMVGDRESDIEFGQRLSMTTVRIVEGDLDSAVKSKVKADHYVHDLFEFAKWIEDQSMD